MDPLIIIKDDNTKWGIEVAALNANFAAIKRAIDSIVLPSTAGTVTSVNNILPVNGNVTLTPASVNAVPASKVGAINGIAQLDQDAIILQQQLPQNLRAIDGILFRGLALTSTNPGLFAGFYYATSPGSYTNFKDSLQNTITISQSEVQSNLITLVRFTTSGPFTKILIPFPESLSEVTWSQIQNKPSFSTVAFTGDYADLQNKPTLSDVALSGLFSDLLNIPDFILSEEKGSANGVASLDQNSKVPDTQISDSVKNIGGAVFIGNITPLTDIEAIKTITTANIFGYVQLQGTYRNCGDIVVSAQDLSTGITLLIGRDTWTKLVIPVTSAVTSVNGSTGAVTITATDLGALTTNMLGRQNGVASLDQNGKVPTSQIPDSICWQVLNISDYSQILDKALYFRNIPSQRFTSKQINNVSVLVVNGSDSLREVTAEILLSKRISTNSTNIQGNQEYIQVQSEQLTEQRKLAVLNSVDRLSVTKLTEVQDNTKTRLGLTIESVIQDIQSLTSEIIVEDQIDVSTLISILTVATQTSLSVTQNPWRSISDL